MRVKPRKPSAADLEVKRRQDIVSIKRIACIMCNFLGRELRSVEFINEKQFEEKLMAMAQLIRRYEQAGFETEMIANVLAGYKDKEAMGTKEALESVPEFAANKSSVH
jgi:hypothetical protein